MIGFPLTDGAVPGPRRESERMRPNPSIPGPGPRHRPGPLSRWQADDLRITAGRGRDPNQRSNHGVH